MNIIRFSAFLLIFSLLAPVTSQAKTITIATIAPRGSSWLRILKRMARKVKQATGVKIKFFAGGVMGDEKLVVRKMRTKQLDGAVLTSVGLSIIQPAMTVLQLPRLFRSHRELKYVRKVMAEKLWRLMAQKGYVMLGWADIGKVYLFSKKKLKTEADLRRARMWAWEDDPMTRHFMKISKIVPKPLAITDVLTALSTGMLDTVYGTPYSLISLQWWTNIKYMIDFPMAIAIGGTVVRKDVLDSLSPDTRRKIFKIIQKQQRRFAGRIHRDNRRSITVLKRNGVKLIKLNRADRLRITRKAYKVHRQLIGKRYPRSLLKMVYRAVKAYRRGAR